MATSKALTDLRRPQLYAPFSCSYPPPPAELCTDDETVFWMGPASEESEPFTITLTAYPSTFDVEATDFSVRNCEITSIEVCLRENKSLDEKQGK